jgi:hypothetical protein
MCEAPPHKKNKIVERAVPFAAGCTEPAEAAPGLPNANPANPRPEATKNFLRCMGASPSTFQVFRIGHTWAKPPKLAMPMKHLFRNPRP